MQFLNITSLAESKEFNEEEFLPEGDFFLERSFGEDDTMRILGGAFLFSLEA